ncbi:hypothetical protein [Streptomyces subrutilus]|uniref:PepSY domain-containing protein n=1 Tax=Streptomyces subrutilus TaxID=36818 RepID=A0A1E5PYN6_9ACTN|nr:hypothetical protein [Streptomyces subrutilus]OEJ34613.1 hypothetical protein BGK67_27690 [Streptomyces subrutilus]
MSESFPPSEQPEQPTRPGSAPQAAPQAGPRKRVDLGRLVPRRRGARWAALGAAVVIVGGAAAAVAVAVDEHHDERMAGPRFAWHEADREGGPRRGPAVGGEHGDRAFGGPENHKHPKDLKDLKALKEKRDAAPAPRAAEQGPGGSAKTAPAPLPSLAVGQAADKAAGAVDGGKVESIRVVAQEGGGSAWLAVVLGPDGVRHAVTVSGTDGTVTSNVPVDRA